MNRDEYLKYNTRKELVMEFVHKLENMEVKDIELIPALLRFIETGDEEFFEEFKKFHFLMTESTRALEMKQKMEQMEQLEEQMKKAVEIFDEYKKEYEAYYDKMLKWQTDQFDRNDNIEFHRIDFGNLITYIENMTRTKNWARRKLYVTMNGSVYGVNSISMLNNKVVIDVSYTIKPVIKVPNVPNIGGYIVIPKGK